MSLLSLWEVLEEISIGLSDLLLKMQDEFVKRAKCWVWDKVKKKKSSSLVGQEEPGGLRCSWHLWNNNQSVNKIAYHSQAPENELFKYVQNCCLHIKCKSGFQSLLS